jgi:DNA-nicking Smr family endonuclease
MSLRRLSLEERELWGRIRRSVRPLAPGYSGEDVDKPAAPAVAPPAEAAPPAGPTARGGKAAAPQPPPLVPIEPRERRRLSRGTVDVDARIDLHGMTQERAFRQLLGFLRMAQANGQRTILVITGKGSSDPYSDRGVLRASVPDWLARPDIRPLILRIEPASRRHGGAGALYVRLRKP